MSKFVHEADFSKIFYVSKLIEFMRCIQLSATKDYVYYFENSFPITKLKDVLGRLDYDYHISDGRMDRTRRHIEHCQSSVIAHFFYPGGDTVYFVLMAKPNPKGFKIGNFFNGLKYRTMAKPNQHFIINHYELARTNQEKKMVVDGKIQTQNKNEVWSYGLSEKYQTQKINDLYQFMKDGNWHKIGWMFNELNSMLPFSQVRIDYINLRGRLLKILTRYIKSSGMKANEIWDKINVSPKVKLGYLTGITINKFAMTDIKSDEILKKIHKRT